MKFFRTLLFVIVCAPAFFSQQLYFPPLAGSSWDTLSPAALGWNQAATDTLYNFLALKNSKAFIALKDGKIVLEKYFGTFTKDSLWYWASAAKSLTSFMIGLAQQDGFLRLSDTSSKYLRPGWTSEPAAKERLITIRHQLTMSTGLKDNVADPYCTLPECLLYQADAGTRWAYHNAPYTLLDSVIYYATSQTLSQYFTAKFRLRTGITGLWLKSGYNNVLYSTPRVMARYGLLMLAKGAWGTDTLMKDTAYYRAMINSSQSINNSYGYLWWLNGKQSYMIPQSQIVFPGWMAPNAPGDMYAALGKNGQVICIAPSLGIVFVRMGNDPDSSFEVPNKFCDDIWVRFNKVINRTVGVEKEITGRKSTQAFCTVYPNPAKNNISFAVTVANRCTGIIEIYSSLGEKISTEKPHSLSTGTNTVTVALGPLTRGVYFYRIVLSNGSEETKVLTGKFISE